VDTAGVLACLTPIWQVKPETASRVRGRIERVLNAAKAERLRTGENPAAWRGHLDATLPKPSKLSRRHHAALPYVDIREFMADLRARPALAAVALELTVLTAARTGEILNAQWKEFDLEAGCLDDSSRANESASRAPRCAVEPCDGNCQRTVDVAELRLRFPRSNGREAAVMYGDA